MPNKAIPMIQVPDVPTAVDWYVSVPGFKVVDQGDLDGEVVWAMLSYGDSFVMLDKGGGPSAARTAARWTCMSMSTTSMIYTAASKIGLKSSSTLTKPFTACASSLFATPTGSG